MAGVSRLQYTNEIRLIRVMCTGKVDLSYIFRAFQNGMDGVFVGACRLGECNYITHGNYSALKNVLIAKKILAHIGVEPERVTIRFMNSSDGQKFVEYVNEFTNTVRKLGPLGSKNGRLKVRLEATQRIVPFVRLVERERLRTSFKTEEEHLEYFEREDINRLIKDLVLDRLTMSEIMGLLRQKTLSTSQIAEETGLSSSEVAKYVNFLTKQGLINYDVAQKAYALAG